MPPLGIAVKREAATQAWVLFIHNATGETPYVERSDTGNKITWRPGQAQKMQNYLNSAMTSEKGYDPNAVNVSVDLKPVVLPLAIKKTIGYVVGYTALAVFFGMFVKRGKKI